jgi:ATP-binding cassette subfamily B protein
MLKTFMLLLGQDAPVLRRYGWMAVAYGVLCGLTITALAPLLRLPPRGWPRCWPG